MVNKNQKILEVENIPSSPKNGVTFSIKASGISDFTHGIFKYPCKFIPHIPRWFLKSYSSKDNLKYGVLDPFMGSGTTLVEASLLGISSYGIDIDPLSKLLSSVKTSKFLEKDFKALEKFINDYELFLTRKKISKKSIAKFIPDRTLVGYWFTKEVIEELASIRFLISNNYEIFKNKKVKNFLEIVLSSIIRKVSKADNQSPKPYISKKVAKKEVKTFEEFQKNLIKYHQAIKKFSESSTGDVSLIGFDARKVDKKSLKKGKVGLVMTSPPYINAFDYVRSLKLENFWLDGFDQDRMNELYTKQVGSEKVKTLKEQPVFGLKELDEIIGNIYTVDKKRAWITYEYFKAMKENLESVHDSLIVGGYYCVVVGNSRIRNFDVDTASILSKIAKRVGYKKELEFSYIIRNRYLRIPRSGRGGFIPKDYVLVFKK